MKKETPVTITAIDEENIIPNCDEVPLQFPPMQLHSYRQELILHDPPSQLQSCSQRFKLQPPWGHVQ